MKGLERMTFNPNVMGGTPCIREMRVTVGTMVGLWLLDTLSRKSCKRIHT